MSLLTGLALAAPQLLPGQYGAELWVGSATGVPVIGEIRGESVSWLLIQIELVGDQLWQEHTTCAVELLDATGKTHARFAEGFVDSLAHHRYLLSATDGHYQANTGLEHLGYDPSWPLPNHPDDPGVIDSDGDGHPGVSVLLDIPLLGTEEIFIAQRAQMILTGTILSADRVVGGLELPVLDQRTLGATLRLLERSPPVRPLPEESGFSMVRLPEQTDCTTLKASLCALSVVRPESCP